MFATASRGGFFAVPIFLSPHDNLLKQIHFADFLYAIQLHQRFRILFRFLIVPDQSVDGYLDRMRLI